MPFDDDLARGRPSVVVALSVTWRRTWPRPPHLLYRCRHQTRVSSSVWLIRLIVLDGSPAAGCVLASPASAAPASPSLWLATAAAFSTFTTCGRRVRFLVFTLETIRSTTLTRRTLVPSRARASASIAAVLGPGLARTEDDEDLELRGQADLFE